jgi:hypothetical protein
MKSSNTLGHKSNSRPKKKVWKILKEMYTMVYDEVHNCKKTGEKGCLRGHNYWSNEILRTLE